MYYDRGKLSTSRIKQKRTVLLVRRLIRSSGCRFSMRRMKKITILKKARAKPWVTRRKTSQISDVEEFVCYFLFFSKMLHTKFFDHITCSSLFLLRAFLSCGHFLEVLKKEEDEPFLFSLTSFPWYFIAQKAKTTQKTKLRPRRKTFWRSPPFPNGVLWHCKKKRTFFFLVSFFHFGGSIVCESLLGTIGRKRQIISKDWLFFFLWPVKWRKLLYFVTVPKVTKPLVFKKISFMNFTGLPRFHVTREHHLVVIGCSPIQIESTQKLFGFDVAFIDKNLKNAFLQKGFPF